MSGTEFDPPEDDLDVLAGEFALGLLDADGLALVAMLRQRDARFDAALLAWEARLMPLAEGLAPVEPSPQVWTAIEAALAKPQATQRGIWESLRFCRFVSLGAAGIAAAALAVVLLRPMPPAQSAAAVARLNLKDGGAFIATAQPGNGEVVMVVSPAGVTVPAGKSDELWLILPGAQPKALGLLPGDMPVVMHMPASEVGGALSGVTLAVSTEPLGGSPTGIVTGPVIGSAQFTPL